jgi:Mn-dependent DtxR family transcriptional regulator
MRNRTIEEYIETIHDLEKRDGRAQTGAIAAEMGVKPPSITQMLQKLEKEGLIEYESYSGARLTPAGIRLATDLTLRHRTIADILILIGVPEEQAESDACRIEHHVSAGTVAGLGRFVRFLREDHDAAALLEKYRSRRD